MDAVEGAGKRLRRDGQYAAEMAYCAPRGIPRSAFLAWSQEDRDAALTWQAEQGRRCPSCGTHPDDWDPERGGRRHAYKPDVEQCEGCSASHRGAEMFREQLDAFPGSRVVLVPNPAPPTRRG